MAQVFKGQLPEGQLNYLHKPKFAHGKRQDSFNALVLIPPFLNTSHETSLTTIREAELLLGECEENLTKVDTAGVI